MQIDLDPGSRLNLKYEHESCKKKKSSDHITTISNGCITILLYNLARSICLFFLVNERVKVRSREANGTYTRPLFFFGIASVKIFQYLTIWRDSWVFSVDGNLSLSLCFFG